MNTATLIGMLIAPAIIFVPWFLIAWKKRSGRQMALAAQMFVFLEFIFLFGALVALIVLVTIWITSAIVKRR